MVAELYDLLNLIISSLILGLLLKGEIAQKSGAPKKRFFSSESERQPIAVTDEDAHEQELHERESKIRMK